MSTPRVTLRGGEGGVPGHADRGPGYTHYGTVDECGCDLTDEDVDRILRDAGIDPERELARVLDLIDAKIGGQP